MLNRMGKPKNAVYRRFVKEYKEMNERLGKDQYLVPYLMSSHPGSTMKEAVELAEYLRDLGYMPEQVQDFTPRPLLFPPVCTIPAMTAVPWKKSMCRSIHMKKPCRGR